ncbi:MAG TPA: multiubiquitin domain-containing protein [Candidatus Limnocylindrales bacterium]|nr:multiubiquitin domain-containing protein [Candidatus Limnocylindrales bacterium]
MTSTTSPLAASTPAQKTKIYEVNIEGNLHEWGQPTISVPQIRELGGLPADQPVIEIDFQHNTERTLGETEVVELKPGQGFGKKVGFKRGDR